MFGLNVEMIDLNSSERQNVERFLSTFNLLLEKDVECTFVVREGNNFAAKRDSAMQNDNALQHEYDDSIVGTCSVSGKILKCFAVKEELQGQGVTAMLITYGINYLFDKGIYEYFIYTMPEKKYIFEDLGLKEIYTVDGVSLLEGGKANIRKYVKDMFEKSGLDSDEKAALVMNCNPFTLGHRYLIEKAAKENSQVVVFIVEENRSEFPFLERLELVKQGTADLKNVTVVPGGEYIISSATFPTYFLKEKTDKLRIYTTLDAGLFCKYIAPEFNIKHRYVGTEPYCDVTESYNAALIETLPKYGIELKLVERKEMNFGQESADGQAAEQGNATEQGAISASWVRNLLKSGNWDQIAKLVPKTTFKYLKSRDEAK